MEAPMKNEKEKEAVTTPGICEVQSQNVTCLFQTFSIALLVTYSLT